jgi:hypothetical protein
VWLPGGEGRTKEEGEDGRTWWMYFVFIYENRTVNLLILFYEEEGVRENDGRVESN